MLNKLRERYEDFDFDYYISELNGIKITATTKIPVLCKKHKMKFYTTYKHAGYKTMIKGCSECIKELRYKRTISEEIEHWKAKFKDDIKYDFIDLSLGRDWDIHTKITLLCPVHGEFETTIGSRRCGSGCIKCYRERQIAGCNLTKDKIISTEAWIDRFKSVHR
jgi:hypothetical protein